MTAKRFTVVDDYHIEYDGDYFDLHKPSDIRSLVTVIGYVTDENEQLKFDKTNLYRCMSKDRVKYNQFRDKVFCCIDKKIDEFRNGDYGDLPCNTIHMFLDLKQEMVDLE